MTNDKDSAVLLPCPWCQKTPIHGDSSYGYWNAFCGDENECPVSPYVEAPTEDEVIAAWNNRQPAQSDALVGALAESDREFGPDWGWEEQAKALRAALEARGLEIKEKEQ